MFTKVTSVNTVLFTLYVDDLLIFGTNKNSINESKNYLNEVFYMNDLGPVDVILGVKVTKRDGECILTQSHYIEKVLRKFDHFDCKRSNTPIDPHANLVPNDGAANHQERYA